MASLTLTADAQSLTPVTISTTDAKMLRVVEGFLAYYDISATGNQAKMTEFMKKLREIVEAISEKQEKRAGRTTSDAGVDANPPKF